MQALLISDLHLTPTRPAIAQAFLSFMAETAPQAQQLYILGDFFEYWVGDDAMEPFHQKIAQALQRYSSAGNDVYFMPGNRDFAIGKHFLKQTGAQWLNDPTLISINGEKVLLMHGDSLCTADHQYLRFRKIIRNPIVLTILRLLPLSYRKKLAKKIREHSQKATSKKDSNIMDVSVDEVSRMMNKYNTQTLIHGHTHRPDIHKLPMAKHTGARRIVLGDWEEKGWMIRTDKQKLTLESFDIPDYASKD